jgi:hypothetical protein
VAIDVEPASLQLRTKGPLFDRNARWSCERIADVCEGRTAVGSLAVLLELSDGGSVTLLTLPRADDARKCAQGLREALGLPPVS